MEITPSVYAEMRERGAQMLLRWRNLAGAPQLSSLVDQTFLRMLENRGTVAQGRDHFLAMWTRAMRWVLVDLARSRKAQKRGSNRGNVSLEEDLVATHSTDADEILDVHEALERLAREDERDARVVELRYYGGCSWQEIAEVMGGSSQGLRNEWRGIKASLRRLMKSDLGAPRLDS